MSSESSKVKTESRTRPGSGVAPPGGAERDAPAALARRARTADAHGRAAGAGLQLDADERERAPAELPDQRRRRSSPAAGRAANDSSPSIAIDPNNPLKMVSAWTRNDPKLAPGRTEFVEYGVSTDGGKTWHERRAQPGPGGFLSDPTTTGNPHVSSSRRHRRERAVRPQRQLLRPLVRAHTAATPPAPCGSRSSTSRAAHRRRAVFARRRRPSTSGPPTRPSTRPWRSTRRSPTSPTPTSTARRSRRTTRSRVTSTSPGRPSTSRRRTPGELQPEPDRDGRLVRRRADVLAASST